ncbi:RNA ligase (ATP) [Thalassoglobus neptunius]|nr:RNA ligase (ATP) [Thalassoglobus neptunius]
MRKLASIQTVSVTEAIPKADAIERLHILGWWVVAKKGEYQPGDKVVYCEIDSLLPEQEEFEFLRSSCYKPAIVDAENQVLQRAGFRIRTVKLRGQVSQGICFPLSILPVGTSQEVGTDVTAQLGIFKYEPPVPVGMGGRIKGTFPDFLSKTDEIRVQTIEDVLGRYARTNFTMTEKLDGTSFTAFLRQGEFGLCSRNQWVDETDLSNTLCRLAAELKLAEKLETLRTSFEISPAIQGEVIGPGIQGNKYALRSPELYVFNVLDTDQYQLVDRSLQAKMLESVGLTSVPSLGDITLEHSVDELVALSVGKSILNPKVQREGIVFRPEVEVNDPDIGGRLSFKAINPKFLLKFDE